MSEPRELTLLAIGDVHLGVRPGGLPEQLGDEGGLDPSVLTPEAALRTAVDRAIELRVDAVLFAGDVVESTNARFEAMRPLEAGVRRLLEARIPVLAVAGNHDVEALPRLARLIDGFELIGEGGEWQSRLVENQAGVAVEILGWSFSERRVRNSPVDALIRNPVAAMREGVPRIGLLHCDLDASDGNYAPIASRELRESGLDAWLLGHIHKPSLPAGRSAEGVVPHGYLGSLVGLDPSETGPHGPWLLKVNHGGEIETRHLPIAPLRWERLEVRVDPDANVEDVGDVLVAELGRFGHEIRDQAEGLLVLGVRPILVGPSRHYEALRRAIREGHWNGINRSAGETLVFIDKVVDRLELAHDLKELARGADPAALMARKLLLLQKPGEERSDLLDSARRALREIVDDSRWSALDQERNAKDPLLEDAAVVAVLAKAGTEALDALLAQRDVVEASEA